MQLEYIIPHLRLACWARMAFTPLMTTYKCTPKLLIYSSMPYSGEVQQMTKFCTVQNS